MFFLGTLQFTSLARRPVPSDARRDAACAEFSPNGRTLAIGGPSTLDVWDVASGRRLMHADLPGGTVQAVAFRSDGSVVAAGGQGIYRTDLKTHRTVLLSRPSVTGENEFVEAGRFLASNEFLGLAVVDVTSGRVWRGAGRWWVCHAWERRKTLIVGSGQRLALVDPRTLRVTASTTLPSPSPDPFLLPGRRPPPGSVGSFRAYGVCGSPDVDMVLVSTPRGDLYRWVPGGALTKLFSTGEDLAGLAIGRGTYRVVVRGGLVLDGTTGGVIYRIGPQYGGLQGNVVSPDGRTFVASQAKGAALFDLASGKPLRTFDLLPTGGTGQGVPRPNLVEECRKRGTRTGRHRAPPVSPGGFTEVVGNRSLWKERTLCPRAETGFRWGAWLGLGSRSDPRRPHGLG